MVSHTVSAYVLAVFVLKNFHAYEEIVEGGGHPYLFAASRTMLIAESQTADDQGRFVRSPSALRSLTLCNCDGKMITTAVCVVSNILRQLHSPAQRCVSTRQVADNIFEMETLVLVQSTRMPRDSGILLTNFACAYPSVDCWWIIGVLDQAGLPTFLQRFHRVIYNDGTTLVEHRQSERAPCDGTRRQAVDTLHHLEVAGVCAIAVFFLSLESVTLFLLKVNGESSEVDVSELEYFVLAPDEPDVDVKYIALHSKGERH